MRRGKLARTAAAFCCSAAAPASLLLCGRGPAGERAPRTFLLAVARHRGAFAGQQLPCATRSARLALRPFGSQAVQRTSASRLGAEDEACSDTPADKSLQTQPAARAPARKAKPRSRRAENLALVAEEEVILPSHSTPRELAMPYTPPGLVHWTPKPAPPRVITTPHMDAKLPEPQTKTEKNVRRVLMATTFVTIWGVAMVFTDNYVKIKSTVVDGILFMTRNDEVAVSYLGPHIGFANQYFPWVSGTVHQVKGKVDVTFKVKGDIGTGIIRFLARRKQSKGNRPGGWATLEFSLTLPNGVKIDISQTPELTLESDLK